MRFLLNQTNARAFTLSLPDPEGRTRALGFEYITDLSGVLERTPCQLTLQSASADGFRLTEVDWNTPAGRMSIEAPAAVAKLYVDGHIPQGDRRGLPLEGRASLKLLDAERLVLEGFVPRLSSAVRIEHLAVEQSGDGGAASVGAVMLRDLQTTAAGVPIQLDTAEVDDVHIAWSPRRVEVITGAITLGKVAASSEDVDLAVEQLGMPQGMSVVGGQICIPELTVAKITVAIDQLASLMQREEGARPRPRPQTESDIDRRGAGGNPGRASIPLDPRLLDLVSGRFAVDVTMDAAMPVIGRRRATHAFRVPIESGTFNYRQLERGLSTLEDAVIDFDVRHNKLVIERDLPIIRLRKNLVEWSLDDEELAMARQRRVRLRTLPRYRLVSSGGGNDFKLNSVRLDPIDIALSIGQAIGQAGGPAAAASGAAAEAQVDQADGAPSATARAGTAPTAPGSAAEPGGDMDMDAAAAEAPPLDGVLPRLRVGSLELSGCLCHPEQAGLLMLTVRNLLATLRALSVGGIQIDVGTIAVDAIAPVQLTFDGVRPNVLSVTVQGLRLQDIKIQRRPDQPARPRTEPPAGR